MIYYGSIPCQQKIKKNNKDCSNKAYYIQNGLYVCGQHSLKDLRVILPVNPNKKKERDDQLKNHKLEINNITALNFKEGRLGHIICYKMQMMKEVPLIPGYLNVFPNYRHEFRIDGYGCSALSPMKLGPVHHNQPGLPDALNIENYHQCNKVWPCEAKRNEPLTSWYQTRLDGYNDPVPHRHKFDVVALREPQPLREKKNENKNVNKNAPLFSIHLTLDGKERKFSYVESRYFYCKAYEILAKQTKEYERLRRLRKRGTNIIICGFDAYPVTKDLYEHYCDPVHAFGHELALYELLTNGSQYSWDRYREEHQALYENMASVI